MTEAEFSNQFLLEDNHYFDKALSFLEEFQWCFNYPVTHLLVRNIVQNIPSDWIDFISNLSCDDLNAVGHGDSKEEWPGFIKEFTKRRDELALSATESNPPNCSALELAGTKDDAAGMGTGMNPKKQMEVKKLARFIHEECKPLGITNLLDIGSGLGHLSFRLHTSYGYRVLGLETKETYVKTANARRRKVCSDESSVQFRQFHLDTEEKCILETKEAVRVWLENCCADPHHCEHSGACNKRANQSAAVALIGLHACGNLAGSILRLFASSDLHSAVILLPCCFHKMSCVQDAPQGEQFENFPLSRKLQSIVRSREGLGSSVLNTQFLRLASQKSSAAWSLRTAVEHTQQGIHVLARSVLQLYAETNNLQIRKLRRRAISRAKLGADNTDIIENMTSRYAFVTQNDQVATTEISKDVTEEIKSLYYDHEKRLCPVIEGLNALQSSLQSVAERLVLTDMLAALEEACGGDTGVQRCHVTTLWNETRSPRARAIIASRHVSHKT